MVIVSIKGRLGNQMFCMALYRSLMKSGRDVYVDLACDRDSGKQNGIISAARYNIDLFSCDYRVADSKIVSEMIQDGRNRNIWKRWEYRLFPSRCLYYEEQAQGIYNPLVFRLDNVYLTGYWQSEKYFASIDEDIRQMYRFPDIYSDYQRNMLENIRNTNSVSVHVRRGDYLLHPEIYGTVSLEYYRKAMRYIQERRENVSFYLFTDDIVWARENFKGKNIVIIEDNKDLLTGNLDMSLMAHCKDNIIANSSFSWWGAWLNDNPGKIVVAPEKWEKNKCMRDIRCEGWIKI